MLIYLWTVLWEAICNPRRGVQGGEPWTPRRVMRSLSLEKTSKIFVQPSTWHRHHVHLNHVLHIHTFFSTPKDGDSSTSLGILFQCLTRYCSVISNALSGSWSCWLQLSASLQALWHTWLFNFLVFPLGTLEESCNFRQFPWLSLIIDRK